MAKKLTIWKFCLRAKQKRGNWCHQFATATGKKCAVASSPCFSFLLWAGTRAPRSFWGGTLRRSSDRPRLLKTQHTLLYWDQGDQRAILNFTPGPQRWNLSPRGEVHPFLHPQGWTLLFRRMEGQTENFTPRG
jgi:hypothetical protein